MVTGANGFVGQHLVSALLERGHSVKQVVRVNRGAVNRTGEIIVIGDIGPDSDWDAALQGVDVIVHLAAHVHHDHETSDVMNSYHRVNVLGTEKLARRAAVNGVRRFVYISSVGVNGKASLLEPLTEEDKVHPYNPYTFSKWQAEEILARIALDTGLELVIIRPPLVYGPGNPGNFRRLLKLVATGIPLPLRSINNRRSLIYVDNLVDAIILCSMHPDAAGNTYLVRDGDDISTPELVSRLATLMGISPRIVSFPTLLVRWGGKISGKSAEIVPLLDSLQIDDSKIRGSLGWRPPCTLSTGLRETVKWFTR